MLLPGIPVLSPQVSEARAVAEKWPHTTAAKAAHRVDPTLAADLRRRSRCRRARGSRSWISCAYRTTGTAFARALERVTESKHTAMPTVVMQHLETKVLVEEHGADLDATAVWAAVKVAPRSVMMSAAATVVSLVPEDENSAEVALRAAPPTRFATVRPLLALLGESKALSAATRSLTLIKMRLPAQAPRVTTWA